jgi:YesN/AraC family two-component response regulator
MPDELDELKERAEEAAHEPSLAPVTLTMAILAVVIATVTLLGHRAHTEEVLIQTKAADQWAYYQAKEIRRRNYELFLDELSVFSLQDAKQVEAIRDKYKKQVERYGDELKEIEADARKEEAEVKVEEARADRYDLAEVLLEAALVISSITLLTRKKIFWLFGIVLAVAGLVLGITGLLIH